jgi:WD40 repeat protein
VQGFKPWAGTNKKREIFAAERTGQSPAYNNKLWHIDVAQNQLLIPSTTNQDQFHIQSLAVNNSQEIYFSKDNELKFMDTLNKTPRLLDKDFERINLMAWGPNEELYFMSGDDIYIYDDSEYKLFVSNLKKQNPEDIPFSGANIFFDMIVDEDKNVYLAYYGNREIIKITPEGTVKSILKSEKPWSPHGIDVFNGEIYALESTIGGGEWWKFWEEDPGIIPRVRKIDTKGNIHSVYNYKN